MNYQVQIPSKIYFGAGTLSNLSAEAARLGAKRALIVTDPGVFKAGLTEPVKEQLSKANIAVEVFAEAEPEPSFPHLNEAADRLRTGKYDLLVGIGGGSSIDFAKGLVLLLKHGGKGEDYAGTDKVPGPCLPLISLPTTAGTGSEVTRVAVFEDTVQKVKTGIVSEHIMARVAIVDPTLTYGCPARLTAISGIDALVHSIEPYTGKTANNFTDGLAVQAMKLAAANLREAVRNGSNKEARNNMADAALLAGIAFSNSGNGAAHALAYPLGSRYHTVHGVSVGLFYPYVMECNLDANVSKYADIARILGVKDKGLSQEEVAREGVNAFKKLAQDIGIPIHLREVGVPQSALEELAVASMDVTRLLNNNAKTLTLDDVRSIWNNAW